MEKFFRKLQHFRTFNFSFLFRKCSRKLCAKNEKSQEKRILATLYPLPISSSLSLFFFLINHPQKKSQKSGKVHAPKKKNIWDHPHFKMQIPKRFQRPLIPSSRSHVWIPFASHDFHVKCIERHMGCVPPRTQTPTSGWGKERFPWDCDSRQRLGRGALRLLAVELSRKRHLQM